MLILKQENTKNLKHSGIYLLKINSRLYVGSSKSLNKRLSQHYRKMKAGNHENKFIQRLVNKYSINSVLFSVLENCKIEELLVREKYWIDTLSPELNFKLDPTTQNNSLSQSKKVYKYTLEGKLVKTYPSCSEAERLTGISATSIASCARGKVMSAGKFVWSYKKTTVTYVNNSSKAKIKAVTMYDKEGVKIKKFNSLADAARYIFENKDSLDSLSASISGLAKGKGNLLKGKYRYSYNDLAKLEPLIIKSNNSITQLSMDNTCIKVWNSAVEASKVLGYNANSIRKVINGERTSYKNYKWLRWRE